MSGRPIEPPAIRRPLKILGAILGVVAAVSLIVRLIPHPREVVEGTPVVQAILDDPGTPAIGPPNADVTIVAFTDYQCAVCKEREAGFEKAVAADGRVRVLYKDWPVFGERSRAAARLALAADRQGKYLAVHEAFMRSRLRLDPVNLRDLAVGAGVDWARLQADLARNGTSIDAQLARQSLQAWSLGLRGTPGYLVGPYLVRGGMSEGDLRATVAAARGHRARGDASLPAFIRRAS